MRKIFSYGFFDLNLASAKKSKMPNANPQQVAARPTAARPSAMAETRPQSPRWHSRHRPSWQTKWQIQLVTDRLDHLITHALLFCSLVLPNSHRPTATRVHSLTNFLCSFRHDSAENFYSLCSTIRPPFKLSLLNFTFWRGSWPRFQNLPGLIISHLGDGLTLTSAWPSAAKQGAAPRLTTTPIFKKSSWPPLKN